MIGRLARLLLGREMVENLLWIRENPDAVVDEEMAAWQPARAVRSVAAPGCSDVGGTHITMNLNGSKCKGDWRGEQAA